MKFNTISLLAATFLTASLKSTFVSSQSQVDTSLEIDLGDGGFDFSDVADLNDVSNPDLAVSSSDSTSFSSNLSSTLFDDSTQETDDVLSEVENTSLDVVDDAQDAATDASDLADDLPEVPVVNPDATDASDLADDLPEVPVVMPDATGDSEIQSTTSTSSVSSSSLTTTFLDSADEGDAQVPQDNGTITVTEYVTLPPVTGTIVVDQYGNTITTIFPDDGDDINEIDDSDDPTQTGPIPQTLTDGMNTDDGLDEQTDFLTDLPITTSTSTSNGPKTILSTRFPIDTPADFGTDSITDLPITTSTSTSNGPKTILSTRFPIDPPADFGTDLITDLPTDLPTGLENDQTVFDTSDFSTSTYTSDSTDNQTSDMATSSDTGSNDGDDLNEIAPGTEDFRAAKFNIAAAPIASAPAPEYEGTVDVPPITVNIF
ncbi:hypothetical protein AYI68_g5245 [Smittium mucronatum]|uniref:Uncharacterized protein n=1 Tax=Smittium mucronatum TaxID=133383 RepID=A0A1R0GUU3_9FUNG|nr:hypothetical protein AYI68_g5245 [Smittium mucronatum]